MRVAIKSHLTEEKLATGLIEITGASWLGREYSLPESNRRFDMAYRAKGSPILVEYDGPEHYRNSLKVKIDGEKRDLAISHGATVIRMPYWLQPDNQIVNFLFDLDGEIDQSYPHGFIKTLLFPASFCELGLERFRSGLDSLPGRVRADVVASLRDRAREHGSRFDLPTPLSGFLAT